MARLSYNEAVQVLTNHVSQNEPVAYNDLVDHFEGQGQADVLVHVLPLARSGALKAELVAQPDAGPELLISLPSGGDA